MRKDIDITFNFRSDTPKGKYKDPDRDSPTLRMYHKLLWSKLLPSCDKIFELDNTPPLAYAYLHHRSEIGEYFLSSDTVIPTYSNYIRVSNVIKKIAPEIVDEFDRIIYTIGGMMVFPGNQTSPKWVGRKMTLNGQRGCHPRICDRFDLTVECIRLYYLREDNPLFKTLARYADFFDLFIDFRHYVEFFLFQDIVSDDYSSIRFFLPFEGFDTSPLPKNRDEYICYMQNAIAFIQARNRRIRDST